jgi:HNH endonuclease
VRKKLILAQCRAANCPMEPSVLIQSLRYIKGLWRRRETAPPPAEAPAAPLYRHGRISPSLRYHILFRDKYRCTACGADPRVDYTVRLQVDHIVPRALGGPTTPDNLRTLCATCNQGKGARPE